MKNPLLTGGDFWHLDYNDSASYFVRSGGIELYKGILNTVGYAGSGWSRTATTYSSEVRAGAYYLKFDDSTMYPSRVLGNIRWAGSPVRCLVY